MKIYITFLLILLTMVLPDLSASATKPIPAVITRQINKYIQEKINRDEAENCIKDPQEDMQCGEEEIKESREYRLGDFNGDNRTDAAVLFILAGLCCGSNDRTYMAIFINKSSGYELAAVQEIGRKGMRYLSFDKIEKRSIHLITREYAPENPLCCPAIEGKTTYIFENGKLLEKSPSGKTYEAGE